MANPYEWSEDRERRYGERNEEQARRAAERHAEQEGSWDGERRRRQRGDYGAGWYGEDASRRGYPIPGPYGRAREQDNHDPQDPGAYDRYDQRPRPGDRRAIEAEVAGARDDIERGWRRLSRGVRQAFDHHRSGYDPDPGRAGGMFGGQDRHESVFSHGDHLGARPAGIHRGRGPKGYVRSDARILEDVNDRLTDDGWLDASDIEVRVAAGEVTLDGHVASREDKRRAEDLAEQASGVKHLQNNLRVRPPESSAQPSQNAAASSTLGSTGGARPNAKPN